MRLSEKKMNSMKWMIFSICIVCMCQQSFGASSSVHETSTIWPMFRGQGFSHARAQNLPTVWSEDDIKWKSVLEGVGQSSPVAWKNRVFVASVQGEKKETLLLSCYHLSDGATLWTHRHAASTRGKISDYNSRAAPTPVVDDQRVYAFFEEGDLVVLTHDGDFLWGLDIRKEYGPFEGNHGLGASPALASTGLILTLDHGGQSWLICLDKQTGNLNWKTPRESSNAWSSPVVIRSNSGEQILLSASRSVMAYDAKTGKNLWEFGGIIGNNVPSITIDGEWIVIGSSRKGHCRVLKIKDNHPEFVWKSKHASSSFGSPLITDGRVYFVNKTGIVFCHELESGDLLFNHRLPSSTWASPLASDSNVWFFGQDGETTVMRVADQVDIIGKSNIEVENKDRVYGYAAVNGHLILRTEKALFAITK